MSPKVVIIANPTSGGGTTGKNAKNIQRLAEKIFGQDHQFLITRKPSEGTSYTRRALRAGSEMIVAVGGDGTANAVVNGFFEKPKGDGEPPASINPDAVMAFAPSGTRNVLVKSYSLPQELEKNLRLAKRGEPRLVDVPMVKVAKQSGETLVRLFLNAAEIGLSAQVIDRSKKIRNVIDSRTVSTIATLISTVPAYRSNECQIAIGDGEWQMFPHVTICVVSNGQFIGGGFKMAPKASTSDGLLDLTILKDSGGLKLADDLYSMKTGDFGDNAHVIYEKCKKFSIRSQERRVGVAADGEPIGFLPASFQIIPRALRFI